MSHRTAAMIGAAVGLVLSLYMIVYVPMAANYERGGCVWLDCGEGPDA